MLCTLIAGRAPASAAVFAAMPYPVRINSNQSIYILSCLLSRGYSSQSTGAKNAQTFADRVRIYVRAGTGGQGSKSLSRPGGDGGDIIAHAIEGLHSLHHLLDPTKKYFAETGSNASRNTLLPTPGRDLTLKVPVGTVVMNDQGQVIGDLDAAGQQLVVGRGGVGGSHSTSDRYCGMKGDSGHIIFELKSIADIGLVGFPNAGKSSFLAAVSKAKPRIADYAFTTLRPQVGVIEFPDFTRLRVADIPGLIEGAHDNQGMGHSFLRHIERTQVLLFLLDIQGFQLRATDPHRSAFECLRLLEQELSLYKSALRSKPAVIAINKMDLPGSHQLLDIFQKQMQALPPQFDRPPTTIVPISVSTGLGIGQLVGHLRQLVKRQAPQQVSASNSVEAFRASLFRPSYEQEKYHRLAASLRVVPQQ